MRIGVVRETTPGERRVALVPETVGRLAKSGNEIVVERGAGEASSFPDRMYTDAGATIGDAWDAELVLKVAKPSDEEVARLREGAVLIAFLQPLTNHALVRELAKRRVTALSMDAIPRITRAQAMDALSSQATVAGYKAVLLAAVALPKFFPMLTTAAGTIAPAKAFIIGAGVAGLQAIATARRLGAVVEAFDTRPVVREQVQSLGAKFLEVDLGETGEGAGGYAKELSEDAHRKEVELLAKALPHTLSLVHHLLSFLARFIELSAVLLLGGFPVTLGPLRRFYPFLDAGAPRLEHLHQRPPRHQRQDQQHGQKDQQLGDQRAVDGEESGVEQDHLPVICANSGLAKTRKRPSPSPMIGRASMKPMPMTIRMNSRPCISGCRAVPSTVRLDTSPSPIPAPRALNPSKSPNAMTVAPSTIARSNLILLDSLSVS